MSVARLISTLAQLQTRGKVTAAEIARATGTSLRTVYRDIDALEQAGVPIYTERGRAGGLRVAEGYQTRLTGLSPEEAWALPFVELEVAAAALGVEAAARSARLKLFSALGPTRRNHALRASERFYLDPSEWYQRPSSPGCLKELASAVWNDLAVSLDYESWRGRKRRVVKPLGLVMKAGTWYLLARRAGRVAIYRVDSIRGLRTLSARKFTRPTLDLSTVWKQHIQAFESSLRREQTGVRFAPAAMYRINRLGSDAADRIRSAKPDAKGWRETSIWIESVPHAAGLLLGFGADVEVLTPESLRQELLRRAKSVAALYAA